MKLTSVNPYNQKLLAEFAPNSEVEVVQKLAYARKKQPIWKEIAFAQRGDFVRTLGNIFSDRIDEFARLITLEMGKPLSESYKEIKLCSQTCLDFANNAKNYIQKETVTEESTCKYVYYEPFGVVLGIVPYNYPFWQVIHYAIPALMAGNVFVLKHSSSVPQCSLSIEKAFREAGFPEWAFQSLLLESERVGHFIKSPDVNEIVFTGGVKAAGYIGSKAGLALKRTVLEIGGSDSAIVMEDADLDFAVSTLVSARLHNSGQSRIAPKRFIVHASVYDDFIELLLDELKKYKYGDPLESTTNLGPLASQELLDTIDLQVRSALQDGAKLLYGGQRIEGKGNGYQTTVLTDVTREMRVMQEETFAPLFPIVKYSRDELAIDIANSTKYSLGATLWSGDTTRAERMISSLKAANIAINSLYSLSPEVPYVGGQDSSIHRLREFVNTKSLQLSK